MHDLANNLTLCAEILRRYREDSLTPLTDCIEAHFEKKGEHRSAISIESIHGTCKACIENHKILEAVLQPYVKQRPKTNLRRDVPLLKVIAQVVIFDFQCYDELEFETAVQDLYSYSVRTFLLYLTGISEAGADPFDGPIRRNWYRLYDREYVDTNLIATYQKHQHTLRNLVEKIESRATKEAPTVRNKKRSIVMQPFSFVKSNTSNHIQENDDPPQVIYYKAKTVPSTTYSPSENTVAMQRKTKEHANRMWRFRRRIDKRQLCRKRAASNARRAQLEPNKLRALTAGIHTFRRPVQIRRLGQQIMVKQTTATILREKAHLERLREKADRDAKFLAEGTGNAERHEAEILRQEEEDLEAAVLENEKKILNAMMSLEKAIAARDAFLIETKQKAAEERENKRESRQQRQAEMNETISHLKAVVEEAQRVSKVHLMKARKKLLKQKKNRAKLVKEENKQLLELFAQEREEEQLRRKDVIARIREMEARIMAYEKTFDFSTLSTFGHLSDMSLADLKDRLISLHFEMLDQLEQKKQQICRDKESAKKILMDAVCFVETERSYWQEQNRKDTRKIGLLKELRQCARAHPEFTEKRSLLIQKSQQRRANRIAEREMTLKINSG